jgi:DNA-binding transcriptional MerR regulator
MLRIGDFARLGGVTVRALRHYEARGLLAPAAVDPVTGYRSYRTEQLEALDRIVALRDLGFSLRDAGEILAGRPDAIEARLAQHRERLATEAQELGARLRRVLALQRAVGGRPTSIEMSLRLRAVPPQRALTIRTTVRSLGAPVAMLFEEAEARAFKDRADRSPFLLFHSSREVEACIPVRASCRMPGVRDVPGVPLAGTLTYCGDYGQMTRLARRMARWLRDAGLRADGPLREVYHRFGADLRGYDLPRRWLAPSSDQFVTELQLPAKEPP